MGLKKSHPLNVKRGHLEHDVQKDVCSSRDKAPHEAFGLGVPVATLHKHIAFSHLFAGCKTDMNQQLIHHP